MAKVTVIIPNFNGKEVFKKCLESLEKQNSSFDITIVDNASTEDNINYINDKYPHFKIIVNKENSGFAFAVNQGIKASKSKYIFLLNNDTEIGANCISNLIKCIERDENIFAVSSKMIQYYDRSKMDDAGDEYSLLGWAKRVGYGKSPELYNEEREIFSACAGAALYRKSVFDEIGLFDENFFAYMEDVDIGYRARIHGYKCIYCPKAIAYHIGSASSGSRYNEFKIKLSARNNIYIPFKNMPWPQLAINFVFLIIGYFLKYLFFLKKGYGNVYLAGLKEGFNSYKRLEKVKYINGNFSNYLKIEWILIKNTLKFIIFLV